MPTQSELTKQISLSQSDVDLIISTCKTFNIVCCWIKLDKNKHLKGLYKFEPKGKSYFLNIEQFIN